VSESALTEAEDRGPRRDEREGRGFFGRIALFVRQVISELRRVVTPTREELVRLIGVVLGFVAIVMLLTFAFDFVSGWFAGFVFGD